MTMDVVMIVEVTTSLVTFLMVMSGLPPCLHMYKTKNTKNVPYIFFLIGFLTAAAGVYYGILAQNSTILNINLLVAVSNVIYMAMYLIVCRSKTWPMGQLACVIWILVGYYWYLNRFLVRESLIQDKMGLFLFVASSFLMFTPALEIVDCIKEKNASGMSRAMLYGGLLCSAIWLLYGLLLKDFYIYAPNIIGVAMNLGKFAMICVYPTKPAPKRD